MSRASFPAMATALALCVGALLAGVPAAAQQGGSLGAERDAVFAQMLQDPANRDLMRRYAGLSVQLRDFEAAASTLERLLDLEPGNVGARVELAIAYFALGSYEIAEYHLAVAQGAGGLSPEQAAAVARYRAETAARAGGSDLRGRVAIGAAVPDAGGEGGLFLSGAVDWRIDLGDANATQWVSEFAYSGFRPGEDSLEERQTARLRTGPEIRIAGDAFGPRLRPFLEVEWVEGDPLTLTGETTRAAGLSLSVPLGPLLTIDAEVSAGEARPASGFIPDYRLREARLGATYRPTRDTRIRLTAWRGEEEEFDTFFPITTTIAGARLSAEHAFDPGIGRAPNRWVLGGFAGRERSDLDDGFFAREIVEDGYGLWLRAFVVEDVYLELGASQLARETTNFGFTTTEEENVFTVQIGWEF